jgi:thiol:disulfide interchange protein
MCGGGKWILLGLLVLVGIVLLVNRQASQPAAPASFAWVEDYDAAVAMAAQKNEPVLLAFKATWCGPCKQMDAEVFSKPAAARLLANWVAVHIDLDQNSELARKYQVSGVPTFIVLSPAGKEVDRTDGRLSLQELAAFLASAQSRLSTVATAG